MRYKTALILLSLFSAGSVLATQPKKDEPQKKNVADEVVWMVGDEPILLSDIEYQKLVRLRLRHPREDSHTEAFLEPS